MIRRKVLARSSITRRGLLIGAGLIAAPFVVRSRPATVEPIPVQADRSYPNANLLISPQTLHQQHIVEQRPIRLLDATTLATYRKQHLPGAVHVWWQDTMELNSPYYGTVLKPDDGEADQGRRVRLLERWGIGPDSTVVVYGDTTNMPAARVCWFLRFLGISAAVLDGGRAGWLGLPGPMTDTVPRVDNVASRAITPQQGFYLPARSVARRLTNPRTQLIDVREHAERDQGPYRGLSIPGALPLPRSTLISADGLIRPVAELAQILASAGIDPDADLMLIGPTGLDTAIPWLALCLLGANSVIITDGGWQEWVTNSDLPLA